MSLTPSTPNFGTQLATAGKSFWDRREGVTAKIVLVVGVMAAAGALFSFWGMVLPFILGTLTSTIAMVGDVLVLMVLTSPIWSKRVRLLVSTAFKLSMRWSTQLMIETDPIGILREHSLDLEKDGVVLDRAIEKISKIIQRISDAIDKNRSLIMDKKGMNSEADRQIAQKQQMLPTIKDPNKAMLLRTDINSLQLRKQGYAQAVGMADKAIGSEQQLLDQNRSMYENMLRYKNLHDAKIDEFKQSADILSEQRDATLAGQEGLTTMQKLLGGDPVKMELINRTVDYLNDEASDLKGALNNFDRWADKDLTDQTLQSGAASARGEQIFAALEQKLTAPNVLISDGSSGESIPLDTVQDSAGTYIPVVGANDYSKYLK